MNLWADVFLGKVANFLTAFVNVFLMLFNTTAVEAKPVTLSLDDYKLVFEDEFEGDALNREVWRPHNSEGLRKGGYWSFDQASVENGLLTIRTEYLENGKFGSGWYTAGISTKGLYERKYGYYECRCILPKGEGMWSAFWLTNSNVSKVLKDASKGQEIDVFESPFYYKGGEKSWKVTSNIHYNGYELQTKYKNVCISALDNDPYENFNTYGVLWTKDEYVFYVNGHEVARTSYNGVSQEDEFMILSCEVDGAAATPTFGWSGNIKNNPSDSFKADFIVDYVRVYESCK